MLSCLPGLPRGGLRFAAGVCGLLVSVFVASFVLPSFASAQMTAVPVITTVAGNGTTCSNPTAATGACGDGGLAINATFSGNSVRGVAVDSAGNFYIADHNSNRIRKVTAATGIISTVAGDGTACSPSTAACGDGGAATSANLNQPWEIAVDSVGNIYFAEFGSHRIRKVTAATGFISTVAGNGTQCPGGLATGAGLCGDGGAATSASLNAPIAVAVDSAGNLYIADDTDFRVRKVAAGTQIITTVAGSGTVCTPTGGTCGDGAAATSASFNGVAKLTVDSAGNLYIADQGASRIRKVNAATGFISTVAGNGTACPGGSATGAGLCGDGGAATSAELNSAFGIAMDSAANLYILDFSDQRIRKVTVASGLISTIAGNGTSCAAPTATPACGDGGAAISANFFYPLGAAVDSAGNLYVGDLVDNRVRKVGFGNFPATAVLETSAVQNVLLTTTAAETITSISVPLSAGGKQEYTVGTVTGCVVGGSAASGTTCTIPITFTPAYPGARPAPLQVVTSTGSISFPLTGTGTGPQAALTPGVISTVAGTGVACPNPTGSPACGDGGPATSAPISSAFNVFVDSLGNVWVADSGDNRVREFTVGGTITTVAGSGTACAAPTNTCGDGGPATAANLNSPSAVFVDGAGNLYISDSGDQRIRMVAAGTQLITTVAGTGAACGGGTAVCGDGGLATAAQFGGPNGLAMDGQGNLYIADYSENRIRMVANVAQGGGNITTVAGSGNPCYGGAACGDGASPLLANLMTPIGIFVDSVNNLYIADTNSFRIRKVTTVPSTFSNQGIITTVAGTGGACGGPAAVCGDGGAATAALLLYPYAVAVDLAGNVYIADSGDSRIRKVSAVSGLISTVVGNGTQGYGGDGGAATNAALDIPVGLSFDSAGNLYIAEKDGYRVRRVDLSQSLLTFPTATAVGSSDSTDNPQKATVSNTGNAALSIPPPGSGSNPSVATYFSLDPATTCPEVTSAQSAGTLLPGADCIYAVDFAPTQAGAVTGPVVLSDNSGGVTGTLQTIHLAATASAVTTTTTLSSPGASVYGASVTITATVAPSAGTVLPTGTVQFKLNNTNVGTAETLNASGQATYTTTTLPATNTGNVFTATYTSDSTGDVLSSVAASYTQVVTAVTLTATVIGTPIKTYDGTTGVTLTTTNYQLTGFAPGDGATVTQTVGTYAAATAGSEAVTVALAAGNFTPAGGTVLANYTLPATATGTGSITAKTLTASIIGTPTKPYDGTAAATLVPANFQLTGLVGSDAITVTLTSGTYAGPTVGTEALTASLSGTNFTATSGSLLNYTLPTAATGPGLINKLALTATIVNTPTKFYDGTAVATLVPGNFQLTGFASGDNASVTLTTGTYASATAGPETVTAVLVPVNFTPTGTTVLANYTLPTAASGSGLINKAALTATIVNTPTKFYDGTAVATLAPANFQLAGFSGLDGASVTLTTGTYAAATAGPEAVTVVLVPANFTPTGATVLSNYTLPTAATGPGLINKLALTATIVNTPTKFYDGTAVATLVPGNFQLTGFASGDNASVTLTTGTYASATAGPETVTAVLVPVNFTPTGTTVLANYILPTTATGPGTITQARTSGAISLTVNPTTAVAGQPVTATVVVPTLGGIVPTGTVTIYDGSTVVGTGTLDSSGTVIVVLSGTTLPVGTALISATYGGNSSYPPQNSPTVTVTVTATAPLDFTLALTSASTVSVTYGGSAIYALLVAPTGAAYPGVVSFTVSGLPRGAVATFTPATVAVNGGSAPVTMSILVPFALEERRNRPALPALALLLLPGLIVGARKRILKAGRSAGNNLFLLLILMAGTTAILNVAGCGVDSGYVPRAIYYLTITASSGTAQHAVRATLTVP